MLRVTYLLADLDSGASAVDPEPGRPDFGRWRELLAHAIGHNGGALQERREDAGLAGAFESPSAALAAALDARAAAASWPWPAQAPQLRIAIHTVSSRGQPDEHSKRATLERCAHLRSIAHGGQTLLSGAARDSLGGDLPDGLQLVDLGRHRLADLGPPEHVFGLAGDGEPAEFELASLQRWPNNLPAQATSFVGRARELESVAAELADCSLLVLTGAGGVGKSRLALQLAAESAERYPDGAWWVELAPIAQDGLLVSALAEALGVRDVPGRTLIDGLVDHLDGRRALVVLDNCEHLLAEAADICSTLLERCPGLGLLATSREPLRLAGERDWSVPPLSMPSALLSEPVGAAHGSDAIDLFVERAGSVRPGFSLDEDNARAVAEICGALDGMPLAIELAAARIRVLTAGQVAAGLGARFGLLTAGARDALPRQQTLRASVAWSHDLLEERERLMFRRLGAFPGSWSLAAAEAICASESASAGSALDLISSLSEKSLVLAEEHGAEVRYRMLETIREFALERLEESGEAPSLRDRHLDFFLQEARSSAPRLVTPEHLEWLERLNREGANLAAAVGHATSVAPEKALELCAQLTWWWLGGHLMLGSRACSAAMSAAEQSEGANAPEKAPSPARARVAWAQALIARHAGDYAGSFAHARAALTLAEAVGDNVTAGRALWSMSAVQLYPDPVGSRTGILRAIEIGRRHGDVWLLAHAHSTLAYSHLFTDEIDAAEELFEQVLQLGQMVGAESLVWYWLGLTWGPAFRVEPERCFEFGARAVEIAEEIDDPVPAALAHTFMSAMEVAQGMPQAAIERLQESARRLAQSGGRMGVDPTLIHLASAHAALGELDQAGEILTTVEQGGADGGYNLALALVLLSAVKRFQGEVTEAADLAHRALTVASPIASRYLMSWARESLGLLAAYSGEWREAEALLQACLAERAEAALWLVLPQALDSLAVLYALRNDFQDAARLLGAAAAGRRDLAIVRWASVEQGFGALERSLGARMGEQAMAEARSQGAGITLGEAAGWASRARGSRRRPRSGWDSLTPTESQVVALVAEGLTNPQIAARMFISRATVKTHLTHAFAKLGVATRTEMAAAAVRRVNPATAGPNRPVRHHAGRAMGARR